MKTKYSNYTDKQLVDGILKNDKPLIDYFFNEKCSKLFSYIVLNVFDRRIETNELVSELFLYLASNDWYKIRQFDFRSKLMTWVSVVAIRFFQKKREQLIENGPSEPLIDMIKEHNKTIEHQIDIHSALAKMKNQRYQKVIEFLDLQDVPPEVLAREMNVTVDNLYNIHRRALLQLRLIMGRKEDYYD